MPPLPLATVFADVPDPRRETKNKRHALTDMLTIAACGVIAGAESRNDMAEYGSANESFLRQYLPLANGIPSPDTFERVFATLDPAACARAFGRWVRAACEGSGPIPVAIDGNSARPAPAPTATGRPHWVTAWVPGNRLVLGPVAVADGSDEVAAIPEGLQTLDLTGAIVTSDAAGRQTEPVGIPEVRPDVAAVVPVNRVREVGGTRTPTTHYDLSRPKSQAETLGRVVRAH